MKRKTILCTGLLMSILCGNLSSFADAAFPETNVVGSPLENTENFSEQYRSGPYYEALKKVRLTGNYREDIIAVASSQIGYCEGDWEGQWDGTAKGYNDHTEYGRFLGSDGSAWCSEFASWCVRMANVPVHVLNSSRGANAKRFGAPYYTWKETIFGGGDYTPQAGDLVLWAKPGTADAEKSLAHTSIFCEAKQEGEFVTLYTIDGNSKNTVRKCKINVYVSSGNNYAETSEVAFFVAPDYESDRAKIRLNKEFYEMEVGKVDYLQISNGPLADTDVIWNSSDPGVVLCKDGWIAAVKEGQAVITAETDGVTLSCVVTVYGMGDSEF